MENDHHDALPLLQGNRRFSRLEMSFQTAEPQPRTVFWASSQLPKPDILPPDNFLQQYFPPGCFNGTLATRPPDLLIKVAASRKRQRGSAFVGVHKQHLGDLIPFYTEFSPPFSLPDSPWKFVSKGSLTFSALLPILTWLYSSSPESRVDKHCQVCCTEDLQDVYDVATRLDLTDIVGALHKEPFVSIMGRHRAMKSSNALHGFSLTSSERDDLSMIFLDVLDLPCRTSFLRDGLLIVEGSPMFVQDVTKIIVPRGGHTPGRPIRSFCLLVPKDSNAYSIHRLLSLCQFITFNAKTHARELSYRKALELLVVEEILYISFKATVSDMPVLTRLADACNLKAGATLAAHSDGTFKCVDYSGPLDEIQRFVSRLLRLRPLLEMASATLTLQRLTFPHFARLLYVMDVCQFCFVRHAAIVTDKLHYLSALLAVLQANSPEPWVEPDLPASEARRIVEVDFDGRTRS